MTFEQPAGGWSAPPPPPPPPYASAPPPLGSPTSPRRRLGRLGWLVGIVALAGVLAAAVAAVTGADNGAGEPEDAVRQFAAAVSNEDILAAARLLPPGEVGSAPELYDLIIKVLQKNGELGPAGKPLAGVDIKIEDLTFKTTVLGPGVAKVYLTGGTVGYDVKVRDLDPAIRRSIEDSDGPIEDMSDVITIDRIRRELRDSTESLGGFFSMPGSLSGLYLMTVKEDGRWFVSYQYTMLEAARELFGLDLPSFGSTPEGPGAASPEMLFRGLVDYVNAADASTIAAQYDQPLGPPVPGLRHPTELRAFADYAASFANVARQLQGLAGPDSDPSAGTFADEIKQMKIDINIEAQPDIRISGDRAIVAVKSGRFDFTATGTLFDERVDSKYSLTITNGNCGTWQSSSLDYRGRKQTDRGSECFDAFAGTDFGGFFFVATKEKGGWYVSPVETIVQYVRYALEAELAK